MILKKQQMPMVSFYSKATLALTTYIPKLSQGLKSGTTWTPFSMRSHGTPRLRISCKLKEEGPGLRWASLQCSASLALLSVTTSWTLSLWVLPQCTLCKPGHVPPRCSIQPELCSMPPELSYKLSFSHSNRSHLHGGTHFSIVTYLFFFSFLGNMKTTCPGMI